MIEWDPEKAESNFAKHGVRFSETEPVFFDPYAITVEDRLSLDEERFVTMGMDVLGRILVVVYTYRGENIRLISARCATRNERQEYEPGI